MPDQVNMVVDSKDLAHVLALLKEVGVDAGPALSKVVQASAVDVSNHMHRSHFFVGTGKGAGMVAEANVFTFRNPDGSPRFKVRTSNLLNSIQIVDAREMFGTVQATVKIGEEYASDVEEGGPGRRAFPFVTPAVEAVKPWFEDNINRALTRLIKEKGGTG